MARTWYLTGMAVAIAATACAPEPVAIGIANGALPMQGAMLAVEDAYAAGFDVPLDTVFEPERNTRATPAVEAAERIVSTPGMVAVLGHSNSAASLTAAPIYNRASVVQLASHSTAEVYSEAGPFSFRMVPPDGQQGRLIADFLAAELPGARVALAYVNDDYGRSLRAAVLDALPPGTVEIVLDAPHVEMADSGMVHRTVLAIVDASPDVVLWLSRAEQLVDYIPGIRDGLGAVPIVGGDGLIPAARYTGPPGRWDDIHFVRLVDLDARPETRRFRERFRARFGVDPDDAAALAYDGTALLLTALRDGVRTGDEMRRYLESLGRDRPPYQGITGPVSFDAEGDAHRDFVLRSTSARGPP